MKKLYRIFIIIGGIIVLGLLMWGGYRFAYNRQLQNDIKTTSIDKKLYKPYILGTTISFAEGGNSADFVKMSDGWGGQEPEHRCAVGKNTIINLYIPDSVDASLRLTVDAFGVFPPKTDKYQEVTVYANDEKLGEWRVGLDGPFVIEIPNGIIKDNTLTLRFMAAKPYSPPPDVRKLSMAVREIKIERILGAQTKKKIGKWIKYNLMDGGIKQTYDTNISKEEEWQ